MYQLAAIAFIVAVAGGATYLAMRPTVASRAGLEDLLHNSGAYSGSNVKAIECDDHVVIGVEGAHYHCQVTDNRGDVDHLSCAIFRTGSFKCDVADVDRSHATRSVDSWD